ncbi:MAG: molybdopterin-dependent oxidoreductase, partial [Chloroflexi bacterium]|nr:molybdopterin-dependent oxidoreductase [Chloroflexota bacterium]
CWHCARRCKCVPSRNAAGDPVIHARDWRLLIDGDVERSFQLDYASLRKLPSVEVTKTLECISNLVGKRELAPFGAELISTAMWKAVRTRDILGLVGGPKSDAAWVAVLSADEFTSALPLEVVMDPATLLAYEMNGEVLPREHGYPVRLLVPNRYGMKNAKWVVGLRPMRREFTGWYGRRNWSKEGIVRSCPGLILPQPHGAYARHEPFVRRPSDRLLCRQRAEAAAVGSLANDRLLDRAFRDWPAIAPADAAPLWPRSY